MCLVEQIHNPPFPSQYKLESKWLRGPLKFLIENENSLPDYIDKQKASEIFKAYKNGDNSKATLVWRLAVLGEWGR